MLGTATRGTARKAAQSVWLRGLARHRDKAAGAQSKAEPGAVAESGRPAREVVSFEGEWVPVKDTATGGIYYWNRGTNETTAVGAPRPQPGESPMHAAGRQPSRAMGVVGQFGTLVMLGAGVSLSFAIVRVLLGG